MPLSAKQMEYLALAWQCFETEPKIDYIKFATVAGLKTPASARELMRVTKNKLKEKYGALSTGLQSSNAPSTPSKRARGTPAATPGSRKRARKEERAEVDAKVGDEEEGGGGEKASNGVEREGEKRVKRNGAAVKSEPAEVEVERASEEEQEELSFF